MATPTTYPTRSSTVNNDAIFALLQRTRPAPEPQRRVNSLTYDDPPPLAPRLPTRVSSLPSITPVLADTSSGTLPIRVDSGAGEPQDPIYPVRASTPVSAAVIRPVDSIVSPSAQKLPTRVSTPSTGGAIPGAMQPANLNMLPDSILMGSDPVFGKAIAPTRTDTNYTAGAGVPDSASAGPTITRMAKPRDPGADFTGDPVQDAITKAAALKDASPYSKSHVSPEAITFDPPKKAHGLAGRAASAGLRFLAGLGMVDPRLGIGAMLGSGLVNAGHGAIDPGVVQRERRKQEIALAQGDIQNQLGTAREKAQIDEIQDLPKRRAAAEQEQRRDNIRQTWGQLVSSGQAFDPKNNPEHAKLQADAAALGVALPTTAAKVTRTPTRAPIQHQVHQPDGSIVTYEREWRADGTLGEPHPVKGLPASAAAPSNDNQYEGEAFRTVQANAEREGKRKAAQSAAEAAQASKQWNYEQKSAVDEQIKQIDRLLYLSGEAQGDPRYDSLQRKRGDLVQQSHKHAADAEAAEKESRDRQKEAKENSTPLPMPTKRVKSNATGPITPQKDGKYHYTPDQIRAKLQPGQTYEQLVTKLKAMPNVVVEE